MAKPKGTLTSAQLEILEAIWNSQEMGATVTEIWETITRQRAVTRTTVLNQVDRLEKRGWLRRRKHGDGFRYLAVIDRGEATRDVAEQFLDAFFGGSASELVMSLLGSKKFKADEIERLRNLLDSKTAPQKPKQ